MIMEQSFAKRRKKPEVEPNLADITLGSNVAKSLGMGSTNYEPKDIGQAALEGFEQGESGTASSIASGLTKGLAESFRPSEPSGVDKLKEGLKNSLLINLGSFGASKVPFLKNIQSRILSPYSKSHRDRLAADYLLKTQQSSPLYNSFKELGVNPNVFESTASSLNKQLPAPMLRKLVSGSFGRLAESPELYQKSRIGGESGFDVDTKNFHEVYKQIPEETKRMSEQLYNALDKKYGSSPIGSGTKKILKSLGSSFVYDAKSKIMSPEDVVSVKSLGSVLKKPQNTVSDVIKTIQSSREVARALRTRSGSQPLANLIERNADSIKRAMPKQIQDELTKADATYRIHKEVSELFEGKSIDAMQMLDKIYNNDTHRNTFEQMLDGLGMKVPQGYKNRLDAFKGMALRHHILNVITKGELEESEIPRLLTIANQIAKKTGYQDDKLNHVINILDAYKRVRPRDEIAPESLRGSHFLRAHALSNMTGGGIMPWLVASAQAGEHSPLSRALTEIFEQGATPQLLEKLSKTNSKGALADMLFDLFRGNS